AHLLVRQHAHPPPQDEPQHYTSALRRMLTGDTGVLALLDALPMDRKGYDPQQLLAMERRFSGWRWKLRARSDRLRSVHHGLALEQILVLPEGEVILFDPVLELGDPAADVSAIAVELLALGAREPLCWPDGYKLLFDAFWSTYLAASGDYELLDVAPPFLAWRALQVAAVLPLGPRAKLFSFAEEVLAQTSFDPDEMRWMSR
ncbi:MAG: hypothetical protein RMJ98_21860, partial [Myxococcales bacterium]|nr:hypothetical protein [Polyangiaceae bacterium]MDW8251951.1 hypothetical protein [Myxococcales bacterium]